MPNFSILLIWNFYLMRIYIINFTPFKMRRKETFRFSIFFIIKKSSTSMSNFINLESLWYINLDYKFHHFILCSEEGKVLVIRFHPLLTPLPSITKSKIKKIYRPNFTSSFYVLKKAKFRLFDFTLY